MSYFNRVPLTRRARDRANVLRRPGGPSGGIPPDPIPNSAVKASSAYGTASQDAGESVAARSAKNVCTVEARKRGDKQDLSKENPAITIQRKPRERNLAGLFACWASPCPGLHDLRGLREIQQMPFQTLNIPQATSFDDCRFRMKLPQPSLRRSAIGAMKDRG